MNFKFDLLGTEFRVLSDVLGDDAGSSSQTDREIFIDSRLSDCAKAEVFYHELTHMILDHSGLSEFIDDKLLEAICQQMGVALSYVISHNNLPKLNKEHKS